MCRHRHFKTMSKLNEVINSLNDENVKEVKETLLAETNALLKNNSQLYERAKKAEGFTKDKEGKWVKREEKPKAKAKDNAAETPGELDYGQKVFISNILGVKINDTEQMKLVEDYMSSGKKLDDLVDNRHFKNDLKDIQDNQSAKSAIPDGSRGANGGSGKDDVNYWLNKGEMPPADKPLLRQEYVNARYSKEKGGAPFTKK